MTPKLPRVFRYNSVELEDPGPEHDPVDVRNLYAATYPEILTAGIDGPEAKDGKHVYTFRKAVGTKGSENSSYLCRASGEGTSDVRLCKDTDEVVAFYREMFGLPDDAVEDFKKDFADEDGHWCNDGFTEKLYCAEFECWRIPAGLLSSEKRDPKDDVPLRAAVVDGAIQFVIGANVLAHATNICPALYDAENDRGIYRVTNPAVFAEELASTLNKEAEDGSTRLTRMLDDAVTDAIQYGAEGVEENTGSTRRQEANVAP
jgi:PRTRC genetic system protein C